MAGSEENLFRRFRLSWVPTWVPDWAEAALRTGTIWKLLAVLLITATISYFALGYFRQQTDQDLANVDAWKQRLATASMAEFPVLLDQLFQLKNERTLLLGIDYLRSMDTSHRHAAGLALRDATERWNEWPAEDGSKQWERTVRILAQIADQLHAPEQALAVELARQSLIRPGAADPLLRASLLTSSQVIFSQTHPVHTAGTDLGSTNLGTGNYLGEAGTNLPGTGFSTGPTNSFPSANDYLRSGEGTRDPSAAADLQAINRVDENRAGPGDSGRFLPAGYSRSPTGTGNSSRNRIGDASASSLLPQTSQIPLFDETGRLIETQSVDPASLTVPGGLIPVGISSPFSRDNRWGSGDSDRGSPYSAGPNHESRRETRIGSSRVNLGERFDDDDNFQGNSSQPSRFDDSQRSELEAAYQVRAHSISASGPSRIRGGQNRVPVQQGSSRSAIIAKPETEIFSSRPEPAKPSSGDARSAANPPQRKLPDNPYRSSGYASGGAAAELGEEPSGNTLQNIKESNSTEARRLKFVWDQMSHIEVMQHLQYPDPLGSRRAVQELTRRGFNADYIAVARRLTSPSAQERYQLVFDLVASPRVEPAPFLRWLSNDSDPDVRAVAIEAFELLNSSGKNSSVDANRVLRQVR